MTINVPYRPSRKPEPKWLRYVVGPAIVAAYGALLLCSLFPPQP